MTAELFLSRFTPSMMSADVLEKIFVQRGDMADRIVEVLRESILTPSKHHTLVIGSRGIGKTHLLSLIQNRIARQDDLEEKVRIAWLREEEWGVASFLDFLYRILRALATRYEDETLREETEQLFSLTLKTAERRAADLLRTFVQRSTLLLIAENLDSLFAGLGKKGQQRLRAYLQEESSWTILASSQALFGGITLYDSPFYGFFDIHHLQELTVDDAARLVRNIAELANDPELATYVQSEAGRARIRAVHHLAGGNHRVYMILSEFLTRDSLDQLVEPFLRMMDDLTPYYQARMEQLSPQQRKIIDLLCSVRGAVPVKEIAKRCFISSQTASSQLKDLRARGYVSSTPAGRDAYYELAEPLMRLAMEVKNQRNGHVRLFLDFLRHWYVRTELVDLLARTPAEYVVERTYLELALAENDTEAAPQIQTLNQEWAQAARAMEWERALTIAKKLVEIRGGAHEWAILGHSLVNLRLPAEALAVFERALALDSTFAPAWTGCTVSLLQLNRMEDALAAVLNGISANPANPYLQGIHGLVLYRMGRLDDALRALDASLDILPDQAFPWRQRSEVLISLGRYDEALESLDRASVMNPHSVDLRIARGQLLNVMGRHSDALGVFEELEEHEDVNSRVFAGRVLALSGLGRHSFVVESATKQKLGRFLKSADDASELIGLTLALLVSGTLLRNPSESRIELARSLYQTYSENQRTGELGASLVTAAGLVASLDPSTDLPQWATLWQTIAGADDEFQLPLRLVDALVEYQKTGDRRTLLRLPIEERSILTDLVERISGAGQN
jgi:tetratricopeptide (TPR) repeat protein